MATTVSSQPPETARFSSSKGQLAPKKEKVLKRDYKAIIDAWTIETDIIERIKKYDEYGVWNELITPDMAMDLLTLNDMGQNRHMDSGLIDGYVEQMQDLKWKQKNGDKVGITKKLKLVDGQHRLWAIFLSGIPCHMLIVVGMDEDVFSYMDIGRTRNAEDITSINGHQTNARMLAQAVKAILLFKSKSITKGTITKEHVPNYAVNNFEQSRSAMNRLGADLDYAKSYWCVKSNNFFTPAQWVFVYYILRTLPGREDDARTFMDRFADGIELKANSPIKILRTYFETDFKHLPGGKKKGRTTRASITTKVKFVFAAWDLFLEGAKVSEIRVNLDDQIIPKPKYRAKND